MLDELAGSAGSGVVHGFDCLVGGEGAASVFTSHKPQAGRAGGTMNPTGRWRCGGRWWVVQ